MKQIMIFSLDCLLGFEQIKVSFVMAGDHTHTFPKIEEQDDKNLGMIY